MGAWARDVAKVRLEALNIVMLGVRLCYVLKPLWLGVSIALAQYSREG